MIKVQFIFCCFSSAHGHFGVSVSSGPTDHAIPGGCCRCYCRQQQQPLGIVIAPPAAGMPSKRGPIEFDGLGQPALEFHVLAAAQPRLILAQERLCLPCIIGQ